MKQTQTVYLLGMITAMLLWGVAWTAGKIAALHSNPEVAAFWRYAFSFVTILPLVWYMKTPLKSDLRGVFYMVAAGLLTSLFNYLFFAGVTHGQAGYGGTIVTSVAPIVTYALSLLIFRAHASRREIVALSVGAFGALILMKIPMEGLGFLHADSIYFIACALVWAVVTIVSQKASGHVSPMLYTTVVFGVTMVTNMLFALPYAPFDFTRYDWIFWVTIAFIGVFPGTFSTALYFVSAGKVGAHRTAVFMFIVPVGAIVSSMLVYGERVELSTVVGCALAFVAVVFFNRRARKSRGEAPLESPYVAKE